MIGTVMCYILLPVSKIFGKITGPLRSCEEVSGQKGPSLPTEELSRMSDGRVPPRHVLSSEQKALVLRWLGGGSSGPKAEEESVLTAGRELEVAGPREELEEAAGAASGSGQQWETGMMARCGQEEEEVAAEAEHEQGVKAEGDMQNLDWSFDLEKQISRQMPVEYWEEDSAILECQLAPAVGVEQIPAYTVWPIQHMGQEFLQAVPYNETLQREWEDLSDFPFNQSAPDSGEPFEFTVMSYNILAQVLLERNMELYMHCQPEFLTWEYRIQNIVQEIQHWEPDVLCLQEVQQNHFQEHLEPTLSMMGYECLYKKRTGNKPDGCATCFKRAKFSLMHASPVEYSRPGMELLNRDNVGLVALLRPHEGAEGRPVRTPVCIGNTHLLYNPRRGDIKLAQLAMLLAEIDRMAASERQDGIHCPVILCGDFNSAPDSPLYKLIRNSTLNYHGLLAWKVSGQEDCSFQLYHRKLMAPLWPSSLGITDSCQFLSMRERKKADKRRYGREFLLQFQYSQPACERPRDLAVIEGVTDAKPVPPSGWCQDVTTVREAESHSSFTSFRSATTIWHPLNLTSVYTHFLPEKGRPEITSLSSSFGITVDYIFYSAEPVGSGDGGRRLFCDGALKLLGRLALLSEDDLCAVNRLPNHYYSSDHLCLLARFALDA
ncbi:protein angel homolog 1 isoform X2 [Latimeria chalumnae]|uniref:protein angel homolog 1 isoform X2 n=1 Tax=Latimeria chalumnae TaxID=7897 RepID=UPI00313F1C9B